METTHELGRALPERAGHSGAVFRGGGDKFGGSLKFQSSGEQLMVGAGAKASR
jgi:hypothetical protein